MNRRNRGLLVLMSMLLCLAAIAGCASIPTGGPVSKSEVSSTGEVQQNTNFKPVPPSAGADQTAIINGFINAATGFSDNFQVARKYLTAAAANAWKNDQRTVVYRGQPNISRNGTENDYKVELDVDSVLDADGIRTPAESGPSGTIQFGLMKVDGEWRINSLPDGVILAKAYFQTIFNAYSLYFYDPTFTYTVPDVRWFPGGSNSVATMIVRNLVNGPAPYLKGAVASAFPDGIRLARDTVPISSSTATVDLSAGPLQAASLQARQQMQAQLSETLSRGLNTVTNVVMRADQVPVDVGDTGQSQASQIHAPQTPSRQIGVSQNELVYLENGTISAIPGMPSVARLQPAVPAQSYSSFAKDGPVAFLNGDRTSLYTIAPGKAESVAMTGVPLTPPSFSPSNWVWSAAADGSGRVFASNAAQNNGATVQTVTLTMEWLKGRTVSSLRVSRDGTRIMVVSSVAGQSQVHLTGILRQDNSLASPPRDLTVPIGMFLDTVTFTLGYWGDETKMIVMAPGTGDVVATKLSLGADPKPLPALTGMQRLSVGNVTSDVSDIYAQTSSGSVFVQSNTGWQERPDLKGISDLAFAG